jgi:hypothetical protein
MEATYEDYEKLATPTGYILTRNSWDKLSPQGRVNLLAVLPGAVTPLTAERRAKIERLLAVSDATVGDLIDADDVRDLLAALTTAETTAAGLRRELQGVKTSAYERERVHDNLLSRAQSGEQYAWRQYDEQKATAAGLREELALSEKAGKELASQVLDAIQAGYIPGPVPACLGDCTTCEKGKEVARG